MQFINPYILFFAFFDTKATLYAKWTNNSISLATPTRAGYTFKGWFTATSGGTQITSATSITANQTIYAQWTANNYTVTYNYNGTKNYARVEDSGKTITGFTGITNYCPGLYTLNISGLSANDKLRLTFDLEYSGLTTKQAGYQMWVQGSGNVTSWSPGISWPTFAPTGTGKIHYDNVMTLTADQVKNASFSLNLRTDYYSAGTLKLTNFKITRVTTKAETKACGSQLGTLPTVNETGFTLNGWYTAATGGTKIATTTTMPPNDVTYYAQWTPNKYTVNYNANGGTGTMASDTATYEANYTTKANAFTRANYVFAGWNEKADGTGTNWTSWIGKPWKWNYTYGITLYAQWTVANYSVNTNPVKYTVTLAQAVAAANSAGGSTITLLRDYTDTSGVAIDRNVTLTTNGKTLTRNSTITVNASKTLTVTGTGTLQTGAGINLITNRGTLNVSHTGTMKNTYTTNVTNPGAVSVIHNIGTLSITSAVTMTTAAKISDPANVDPIAAVRNESSGTATISNAKISGTDGAVVNLGKLTLQSGTITGGRHHAVHNRSGTFNMNGGSVIRTGTDTYSALCNYLTGNTTITAGSVSGNKTAISTYSGTLTMKGGSVTCSTETAILQPEGYRGTIDISNGTIYGHARGIINRGTLKVSGANTKITGNTSHGVWNTSGATMTMSSGTITANAGHAVISNEGNFTMNGGTLTKTITNSSISAVVLTNYDGAKINITGGTITNANSATTAAVILEGGTLNMSGGTINAKQHGMIIKGSSNVRTTGGTIMGNSANAVVLVNDSARGEFINTTIKSNYAADPYAVLNSTVSAGKGNGGNCIIRSRAANFGLTGRVGSLVIATTNTSAGQASELVRIYNAPTTYVLFPTWTDRNGQDDIKWYNTSKNGNYNEVRIYKSNHNNETGRYNVHIYDSVSSGTARNNIGGFTIDF